MALRDRPEKGTEKLTIYVPGGLHDQVLDYCDRTSLSQSAVIRLALHEFLDRHQEGRGLDQVLELLSEDTPGSAKLHTVLQLAAKLTKGR